MCSFIAVKVNNCRFSASEPNAFMKKFDLLNVFQNFSLLKSPRLPTFPLHGGQFSALFPHIAANGYTFGFARCSKCSSLLDVDLPSQLIKNLLNFELQ